MGDFWPEIYYRLRPRFREWRGEDGWLRLYCPHCDKTISAQSGMPPCCKRKRGDLVVLTRVETQPLDAITKAVRTLPRPKSSG